MSVILKNPYNCSATHDLDVHASTDTSTTKSDSKDISASLNVTMYGGGASGASLGYGEQHSASESETHTNSTLSSNTINLDVTHDVAFKGATVKADNTLNLTVGNNLDVESVRDSYSSNSNGFNVSAGVSTSANAKASTKSANGSVGTNTANMMNKETLLTSLSGDSVNITASNNRDFLDSKTSYKGTLSSSSSRDTNLKESVVSSSINGNNIAITSGKDTTLQAANLKAAQNIQVDAAGDINVLAKAYREASLHQESKSSFGGLVSSASLDSTDAVKLHEATVKTEAKNIIMNSGKDITVVASNVSAADALSLSSVGDTNIVSGQEVSQSEHWSKKSGFFSGGGNLYSSEFDLKSNADITAKGSTLDGNTVTVTSGNDTNIKGSAIVGDNNVALNTGKSLTIEAANEQHSSEEKHETSGWGIYGSSGGLGFTIGQQAKKRYAQQRRNPPKPKPLISRKYQWKFSH